MKRVAIVVAHPDDEVVGALELMSESDDFAILQMGAEVDMARHQRAMFFHVQKYAHGAAAAAMLQKLLLQGWTLAVPSPTDTHAEHQAALTMALSVARTCNVDPTNIIEYSIEKFAPYCIPRSPDEVENVHATMERWYGPEYTDLRDAKFYLFKGYSALAPPSITVTASAVGLHSWPDAPEIVSYLRSEHRHVFTARLTLRNVKGHDRDQEFHLVKDAFGLALTETVSRAGNKSCEAMALHLAMWARVKYRCSVLVRVGEDGENWSEVTL